MEKSIDIEENKDVMAEAEPAVEPVEAEAESSVNSKMLSLRPGSDNLDARQRLRAERIAIEES